MSENTEFMEQFEKAYEELSDAIFRHCYFRIGDREKAKDLMQETFIKSWQYLIRGGSIISLKPFLYKVAGHLIIDEYRKKKEVSLDLVMAEGFEPRIDELGHTENSIDAKFVIRTINQLDEKYREAVLMRYVDELSPKEISDITGESENNVSVRIHRGIKQLKELLNDEG